MAGAQEIAASRGLVRSRLLGRERTNTPLLAGAFLGASFASAILISSPTSFTLWVAVLAVLVYAAVSQVEFELGLGSAVPPDLVVVPMLFVLPTGAVPLCVAARLVLGGVVGRIRSRRHGARLPVRAS
jgi:hypothetical protein